MIPEPNLAYQGWGATDFAATSKTGYVIRKRESTSERTAAVDSVNAK